MPSSVVGKIFFLEEVFPQNEAYLPGLDDLVAGSAFPSPQVAASWRLFVMEVHVHQQIASVPVAIQTGLVNPKRNEGERKMTTTSETAVKTAVKDPVCGMEIDPAKAAGFSARQGQTYYFCGLKCKEKFDHNPEQYLGKAGEAAKAGHGCCG